MSVDGGVSWRRLSDTWSGADGGEIRFLDALDGYVLVTSHSSTSATPSTSLFVTHDGGKTWQGIHPAGSPQRIEPGRTEDWMLAGDCSQDGTTCQYELDTSTNRGLTWTRRAALNSELPPVLVRRGTSGWIYGSSLGPGVSSTMLYSADDGLHWSTLRPPCPSSSATLASTSSTHLWIVCGGEPGAGQQSKSVYRSSDAGQHWQLMAANGDVSTPSKGQITSGGYVGVLAAVSDQRAWLGLSRGTLLFTADGGTTWAAMPSFPGPEDFFGGLQFLDASMGWAGISSTAATIGGSGVYRTTNGGTTWALAALP